MFINLKSGHHAFIVSHDTDVVYSGSPDKGSPHHTVPSAVFFGEHREATREEIEDMETKPKEKKTA
jgi:hypothetical protein